MTFRVSMTSKAELQLANAALWWADNRSIAQAVKWLDGFEAALQLLAHNPERWPIADDGKALPFVAYQMTYGLGRKKTHRAVFEIRNTEVIVHAIRHLAQDALTLDDF